MNMHRTPLPRRLAAATQSIFITFLAVAGAAAAHADAVADKAYLKWQRQWELAAFLDTLPLPFFQTQQKSVDVSLSVDIAADTDAVFAFLSDIRNHDQLQPFVREIIVHNSYQNELGNEIIEFTAIEDIPIGVFTIPNAVYAKQEIHVNDRFYESDTYSFPHIKLHVRDDVIAIGEGQTRINETIHFTAHEKLIDFTVSEGTRAHQETLDTLKSLME